jgi:hypothetical protein
MNTLISGAANVTLASLRGGIRRFAKRIEIKAL